MDIKWKNIYLRRALIFQDVAIIEGIMNRLICLHFLNTPLNKKFISELLQNPYFSFELRKRLFKSAYKEKYPEVTFPWKSLEEMQRLRNIIAHSPISHRDLIYRDGKRVPAKEPYYSYHVEEKDAVLLHEEFKIHMDIVAKATNKISKDTKISLKEEQIPEI